MALVRIAITAGIPLLALLLTQSPTVEGCGFILDLLGLGNSTTTACLDVTIANGEASYSNSERPVGSEVSFVCNDGYELVGAQKSTCQSGSTWSPDLPTCAACPEGWTAAHSCQTGPDSCYLKCFDYVLEAAGFTFSGGDALCAQYTGRTDAVLAEPRGPAEFAALEALTDPTGVVGLAMVGVSDLAEEGVWAYRSDGVLMAAEDLAWLRQPTTTEGHDCLVFYGLGERPYGVLNGACEQALTNIACEVTIRQP